MNWNQTKQLQDSNNPMGRVVVRPNSVDLSEQFIVKDELAIGLYDGTLSGFKLASAMARPLIDVVVAFMGLPTPVSKSPAAQAMLDQLIKDCTQFFKKVFSLEFIVGTAWAFPNWDSKRGQIYHELIPNSSVTDIIRDINNGEISKIMVNEQLTVTSGENRQSIVNRKRSFTPQTIVTEYSGDVPRGMVNSTVRNPAGIMPVAFAHGVIDNSKRGKSAFTPVISHLKNLHDVLAKWVETLAKFNVKWVQSFEGSTTDWFTANASLQSGANVNVNGVDFILNKEGKESTEFIFPQESVALAHEKAVATIQNQIIFGGGVPEMAFGGVATGNHASAEQQMTTLSNTVLNAQNQNDAPAKEYLSACLRLMTGATMQNVDQEFDLPWNDLEVVSQEVAAKIQQSFADAMQKLTANASVPLETQHAISMKFWPKGTEPDFEIWKKSLGVAAKYKQFQTASLTDALDVKGEDWDAGAGE